MYFFGSFFYKFIFIWLFNQKMFAVFSMTISKNLEGNYSPQHQKEIHYDFFYSYTLFQSSFLLYGGVYAHTNTH